MSRRNWYFSVGPLSVCHVSGSMIWIHADLYQCTAFSLPFLGLTENSSIGFQWGVFHLRQSSVPFPIHPFWPCLFILRSNFSGCFLIWDLLQVLCPQGSEKPPCSSAVPLLCCYCCWQTIHPCKCAQSCIVKIQIKNQMKYILFLNNWQFSYY